MITMDVIALAIKSMALFVPLTLLRSATSQIVGITSLMQENNAMEETLYQEMDVQIFARMKFNARMGQ